MRSATATGAGHRVADRVARLPDVGSRNLALRVQAARARGVDVLPLLPYAERPVPPEVAEAVVAELSRNREAPSRGLPELLEALVEYLAGEIGIALDPDANILVTNGAMQGINVVFRAILDPGDEVLVPAPCFFFGGCVELAGGRPVYVQMDEDSGFAWDLDRLEAAITGRTVAVVVNTPVNPTGVVLGEDELGAIAELASRHDLLVIADESYDTMVYDGRRHVSIARAPAAAGRTLLVRSFTKSFAMPAWRIGYVIGPAPLIDACTKTLEWELLHSNHVAQAGVAAAVRGSLAFQTEMAQTFELKRDVLIAEIDRVLGLRVARPSGGPFLFINTASVFGSSETASQALLDAGVPTTPGHYCESDRHVRLAFGAAPDVLREAGRRIAAVVGARRQGSGRIG